MTSGPKPPDGPSLETYVETRFNLLTKAMNEAFEAADMRYQQRFDAQSDALRAALLVVKEAVVKAESATEKRFESVNEFRQTLTDQASTFMPRKESEALYRSITDKLDAIEKAQDRLSAEREGVRGGWGYAVGVVGFLIGLGTLAVMALKLLGKG